MRSAVVSKKLLITVSKPEDAAAVKASGAAILAEYPHAMLVRCSADEQERKLKDAGVEMADLPSPEINLSGVSFTLSNAQAAQKAKPIRPGRVGRAYYLVQLVGPAKSEWLEEIGTLGGSIQGGMPGFTFIVGIDLKQVNALKAKPYIEAVTPYRPAMKIAPELTRSGKRLLNVNSLSAVEPRTTKKGAMDQVQVQVFPGESTAGISAAVTAAGGTVLAETPESVTAIVPSEAIPDIAQRQGVQSILPHRFPIFFNDRALAIMSVPSDGLVDGTAFLGTNQVIAIADSGLGTADTATPHSDFEGRVSALVSFPLPAGLIPYTLEQPGFNDGPADVSEGHGTHVAGSALGSGAAARKVGANISLQGAAPRAQLYFQAVEQIVRWKSKQTLLSEGRAVPPKWPLPPAGLYALPNDLHDLFRPAYAAGARIHTNSWGSSDPQTHQQYDGQSQDVDEFMFNHRDMLILFAAGNDGVDEDGDGLIDLGSISPPSTAKNCLTVGASESNRPAADQLRPPPPWNGRWSRVQRWRTMVRKGHITDDPGGMTCFSSRGPTEDGRIKPDVVAPGASILSVRSSAVQRDNPLWGDLPRGHPLSRTYCWSGGTSMATPLVAGTAALVRQYLIERRGHVQPSSKPSGALIKAFLVNGAEAMPGQFRGEIPQGPNPVSGFGRINFKQTISADGGEPQFDDDPGNSVTSGEIKRFHVNVIKVTLPLKITMAWTDAPSLPGNGSLENKLYLQVVTPDGAVLGGDVSAFPIATNNVQQVVVAAPTEGTYEIRVRGIEIRRGSPAAAPGPPRQDFALVVSNCHSLAILTE
jgi:serine protease AprX